MDRQTSRMVSVLFAILVVTGTVHGHGGMVEPPMRSIMWRYGFDSPVNYDWNALFCGGRQNFIEHKGKCGFCGDAVQGPFANDKGGVYDTGVIVRHYPAGLKEIEVKVELTAHHKGYFEFKLCANNEGPITQDCLNRYPLPIKEAFAQGNPLRYSPPVTPKLYELHLALPPGVICDRCVLQWTYTAGNSFGQGKSGHSCVGCGYQETFVNCADISIGGTKDRVPVHKSQIQNGGVFEIGDGADVTAVLDKAEPGASVSDILRELGLVIPSSQSPHRPDVPASRRIPVVMPMQSENHQDKPKTTSAVVKKHEKTPVISQLPVQPVIPNANIAKRIIPKPILSPLNRDMNRRISSGPVLGQFPTHQNMGMIDFHQGPSNDMLIDAPIPTRIDMHNIGVGEMIRNRNQEVIDHWSAPTHDTLDPNAIEPPQRRVVEIQAQNDNGLVDNSLVDAVYSLRDQMSRPDPQKHVPQVDIYGRARDSTAFGEHARHDTLQHERERSRHYMEELDKLKRLGHHVQGALSDYHNKQYRQAVNSESYPTVYGSQSYSPLHDRASYSQLHDDSTSHFDNYIPHETRDRQIADISREAYIPRQTVTVFTLPRRIMVHSMSLARRLMRRYPVLRGRVYLSRRAHYKNKYARRLHRYARRHRHI